ncbi:MAG: hypothetical protein GY927_07815 [bacterium]|nr:hypothetical protein [bacterium]
MSYESVVQCHCGGDIVDVSSDYGICIECGAEHVSPGTVPSLEAIIIDSSTDGVEETKIGLNFSIWGPDCDDDLHFY